MKTTTQMENEISFYKSEIKILEDILVFINNSMMDFYKGDLDTPTLYCVNCVKSYTVEKISMYKHNVSICESIYHMRQEQLMNVRQKDERTENESDDSVLL